MPSWPAKNPQASRPQAMPTGTPAASAARATVDGHPGHRGAHLAAGEAEHAQHRQVAAAAADRGEQQVREREQRGRAEREAEQQRQVLDLAEVHQVGGRSGAGHGVRAERVEPRRERADGLLLLGRPAGTRRPAPSTAAA